MEPIREILDVTVPGAQPAAAEPSADGAASATVHDADAPAGAATSEAHDAASSVEGSSAADAAYEPAPAVDDAPRDPAETLSPAVRRLVRQYDLDITGIHGTGPAGRIRVGDVIGMLGTRSEGASRPAEAAREPAADADDASDARGAGTPYRGAAERAARAAAAPAALPATTVFECDLSRVLAHRKQQRRNQTEILLTSYCLVACGEALKSVPELVPGDGSDAQLGVLLTSADGEVRTTLVDAFDDAPLASIDERMRSFDQALRAIGDADLAGAHLLIHHYGLSGSLLATPTPLGAGHAASVGVGRVRRQIVVKTTDGDEAPRVAAMCYVTLTYLPDRLTLNRANRFTSQLVRVLEQWPE
jgi:2-oxoglutarate dehydrogenase E2 component (dihydrolipoamide succinyltransferase)